MIDKYLKVLASAQSFEAQHFTDIDWQKFCAETIDNGIASLFYMKLGGIKEAMPSSAVDFFRTQYENALIYKDMCINILGELQPKLSAASRVVITQGLALNESIYQEPQCRSMGDIDLFLPDRGSSEARRIFLEHGFSRFRDYENVVQKSQIMIDLHDGLWGTDRFQKREYIIPEKNVKIEQSRLIPGFFILNPKDLALHCAFHGVKHGFYKKIWSLDLLRLYNEGCFLPEASTRQEYALKFMTFEHLSHNNLLPRVPFHDEKQYLSLPIRKTLNTIIKSDFRAGAGQVALGFLCPSLIKFVRYMCSIIMPPRNILRQMYGDLSYPVLVVKRLWELLQYAWRYIFK